MDMTVNRATFASRSKRLSNLLGWTVSAVFVLSGIDLRAVALGGLWLRDITVLIAPHNHA